MSVYATGKHAFGFCDRCGFRYDYMDLHMQVIDGRYSGLKVCPDCLDVDHEQLAQGEIVVQDPQNLLDPRPDTGLGSSRAFFGWNPVGNPSTLAVGAVGKVTVSTS